MNHKAIDMSNTLYPCHLLMLCPRCTSSPVSCGASLHPMVMCPGPTSAGFDTEPECRPHSLGCYHLVTPLFSSPSPGCYWDSLSSAVAVMMTAGLCAAGGHGDGCCGDGYYGDGYSEVLWWKADWCRMGCGWQRPGTEASPWSLSAPPAQGSPRCHCPQGSSLLPW